MTKAAKFFARWRDSGPYVERWLIYSRSTFGNCVIFRSCKRDEKLAGLNFRRQRRGPGVDMRERDMSLT